MAAVNGEEADAISMTAEASKGRFVTLGGHNAELGGAALTYYHMKKPCSSSPTGWIHWTNTTGDDTGKPACAGTEGDTEIVHAWPG